MTTISHQDGIIIAIDGPAGSGKSSTARAVAAQLGYRHLDSGAFYRGITLAALRSGIDPARWPDLTADDLNALGVAGVAIDSGYRITIGDEDVSEAIRRADVNRHVSTMAAVPGVRDWLLGALQAAGSRGRLVADGRDIGTVVFPEAELKIFLVADARERARRRLLEQGIDDPRDGEIDDEAARLARRDDRDSEREVAPLVRAPDAILIDTTRLTFDEQVEAIVRLARGRGAEAVAT